MKDSKEKEHRISNLKNMINNVKEDNDEKDLEYDDIEEDSELINYLNEETINYDELEIDDEFIYRPGDEDVEAINLEENPIDENFLIKTPDETENNKLNDIDELNDDIMGDISENFDNVVNAKIRGMPILAIVSTVLGVILLIISVFIFQSRSDRVIDNVVAGESSFMFVIFLILGVLFILFGIYKLFNIDNPLKGITSSIDSIGDDDDDKKDTPQKPAPESIPKSSIPLDKEAYKIGEFDMDDIKTSLKKPTSSKKIEKPASKTAEDSEDIEEMPPADENQVEEKELTEEEIEEIEYEKAKLDNESIDDIFAEVEDIDDIPIISIDSKEREE
ncbi:MAG: topoisomerase IV [Methanobrevibacter sp.]|nr:topoisomerase IV [Methanobrevibacter sp.]MBQ2226237.1 topoisomerase IV [Methanobrevibacter sp.]MBQ2353741.1 topoisomerase IV [Methanobrevibacter sp.]